MIKTKKAGFLTKVVILGLLVYFALTLLGLNSQIASARAEQSAVQKQVAAQRQRNADLAADVQNADDPKMQENLARDKLELVVPGEKVFIDVTN